MNTSFSHQNPWFPGFLERMACCALPPTNINDVIIMNDHETNDSEDSAELDDLELEESSQKGLARKVPIRWHLAQSALDTNNLPSPTLSPSRRELDRWDPSCMRIPACCTPSYAGSTATTESIMSEEEEYVGHYNNNSNNNTDAQGNDEIRSNATTQVISHRKKNTRRNELLATSLASAEKMLKQQLLEEEARALALKARREGYTTARLKR